MQTIVELPEFLRSARAAGMTEAERLTLIDQLARDPLAGISLGGGLYKVRLGRTGSGKSGGYRSIYFFGGDDIPIFLITCFAKNQKDSVSRSELLILKAICEQIERQHRKQS